MSQVLFKFIFIDQKQMSNIHTNNFFQITSQAKNLLHWVIFLRHLSIILPASRESSPPTQGSTPRPRPHPWRTASAACRSGTRSQGQGWWRRRPPRSRVRFRPGGRPTEPGGWRRLLLISWLLIKLKKLIYIWLFDWFWEQNFEFFAQK